MSHKIRKTKDIEPDILLIIFHLTEYELNSKLLKNTIKDNIAKNIIAIISINSPHKKMKCALFFPNS